MFDLIAFTFCQQRHIAYKNNLYGTIGKQNGGVGMWTKFQEMAEEMSEEDHRKLEVVDKRRQERFQGEV